jgi:hypothetical protein
MARWLSFTARPVMSMAEGTRSVVKGRCGDPKPLVRNTQGREVRGLRKANEILKLASAFFAQAELDHRFKC